LTLNFETRRVDRSIATAAKYPSVRDSENTRKDKCHLTGRKGATLALPDRATHLRSRGRLEGIADPIRLKLKGSPGITMKCAPRG
jgi:hypothetical protein